MNKTKQIKNTRQIKNNKKVFIILPGYNEEKHIREVILRTKKEGFGNIVFVDDGSRDKSSLIAEQSGAIVLRHIVNLGKGAAAKTGCEYALKKGAKIIVLMDSDGQHHPEDIKKFLKTIENKDIVFGYRKLNNKMPFVMLLGNAGINLLSHIINGIKIKDTQSGFRCMTTDTYKKIRWTSPDYSMESEMIANVAKKNLKFTEMPIDTIYHDNYKGTTVIDGLKIFINMIKFRFRRG
ncbi:MAG: glycosyltransferase family 2 protein [Candidatus Nanoarchaeia archaeon]